MWHRRDLLGGRPGSKRSVVEVTESSSSVVVGGNGSGDASGGSINNKQGVVGTASSKFPTSTTSIVRIQGIFWDSIALPKKTAIVPKYNQHTYPPPPRPQPIPEQPVIREPDPILEQDSAQEGSPVVEVVPVLEPLTNGNNDAGAKEETSILDADSFRSRGKTIISLPQTRWEDPISWTILIANVVGLNWAVAGWHWSNRVQPVLQSNGYTIGASVSAINGGIECGGGKTILARKNRQGHQFVLPFLDTSFMLPKFTQLAEHPYRGTVVIATQAIPAKLRVINEMPLVVFHHGDESEIERPACLDPFDPLIWTAFQQVLALPKETHDLILSHFCRDVSCPSANALRAACLASTTPIDFDIESLVQIAMIIQHNCFHGQGNSERLFPFFCKISHSCVPNCFWFLENGGIVLRTIVAIEKGEELTIDYASHGQLSPIGVRREYLERTKAFICMCPRCSALVDDTRTFYCVNSPKCSGFHRACGSQLLGFVDLTNCNICGHTPTAIEIIGIHDQEDLLPIQLKALNMSGDVPFETVERRDSINAVLAPHPNHFLSANYWDMKASQASRWSDSTSMIEAAKGKLESLNAILLLPSPERASAHDRLGYCESRLPGLSHLLEAQSAFRKSVAMFAITHGEAHTVSHVIVKKLVAIQAKLGWNEHVKLPLNSCSLCGIVGIVSLVEEVEMKDCGKCGVVSYCCVEHQRAQWGIHKKHCGK
ncbi:UNVERIFIED_CONTAM: hypothetical protein HDU68_009701 [Siphonaria sp. JEL0065]|nr:hypothetical protein HDU68_009701 [Siphonaria sp. JEL0065]